MNATIDINDMPVADRLRLMESLWDSLCDPKNANDALPAWHAEVLAGRMMHLDSGKESTRPWADAKEDIRRQARAK
jgi:putative addiction module component (TIGR02574 family)